MSDFPDIIKKYTSKYNKKLKLITSNLNSLLNITTLTFFKTFNDGKFITLSNHPEQLEFYYHEKVYLDNPYFVDPKLLKSGFMFDSMINDDQFQLSQSKVNEKFQVNNAFIILDKKPEAIEGFYYGANLDKKNAYFNFLNYFDILKKFNSYFLQETSSILEKIEYENYNIRKERGEKFFERDQNLPLSFNDSTSKKLIKSFSPLTPQEEKCIELYRMGYSAQATASLMGLSRRTVEHYFENIKNKLGYYSKSDLLYRG